MKTTTATERPILFSGPMVRAILDGKKTQTRRVVKNPSRLQGLLIDQDEAQDWSPYGRVGDQLWVRETAWYDREVMLSTGPRVFYASGHVKLMCGGQYGWAVGGEVQSKAGHWEELLGMNSTLVKKPSIFMPRWACRIGLEVAGVRVERVQEISEEDARAEGVEPSQVGTYVDGGGPVLDHRGTYRNLWDLLNAKRGFGWDKNPWVWVVEFKRVTD